jgi:hypothetical protein
MVGHGTSEMGANPVGQLSWEVGKIIWQNSSFADQFSCEFDHISKGLGDLLGQGLEFIRGVGNLIFDPAHHGYTERGFPEDLEHAEPLLSHCDDIATVVFQTLAVKNLGTTPNRRHPLLLGVPTEDSKTTILSHHRAQHHAITGLKNMKRQNFLWKEHHIRKGKQR